VVAWSRILDTAELLCAINTDPANGTQAYVTIDADLNAARRELRCLYSTESQEIGQTVEVENRNGRAVLLRVPPAGFVVYG
jgi:hypothetical protein